MLTEQTTLSLGERLRDEGMAKALEPLSEQEIREIVNAMLACGRGACFTAEDLRASLSDRIQWTLDSFCNALGGVIRGAAKRGVIEKTGRYVASGRAERRHSMLAVWRVI